MAGLAEIIQSNYGDKIAYKHPIEDFTSGAQLIVNAHEEAVYFENGKYIKTYSEGRHTIQNQNIPLLGKLFNRNTGGKTPFSSYVYFVKKTEKMNAKWGTSSRIEYEDPVYKFPLKIGVSGEMRMTVSDSRKLVLEIMGSAKTLTQTELVERFRKFLVPPLSTNFIKYMKMKEICIFEIHGELQPLSAFLHEELKTELEGYGISMDSFSIAKIVKPDKDPLYIKFCEERIRLHTSNSDAERDKARTIIDAEAAAAERRIQGYSYPMERAFDIAEEIAQNESIGEFTNLGIGMGMMTTIGNSISGLMQDSLGNVSVGAISTSGTAICADCGSSLTKNAKFCPECGKPLRTSCPDCNANLNGNVKFCPECGRKL